jgi:glycerophosphoryl diester phosphodiesterase
MVVRHEPLQDPIGFAHRGASAHAPENTLEAFSLALRLGAGGLESDVWLTRDGIPVLDHDGVVRGGLRRKRPISSFDRADLPRHIPSLDELYREIGAGVALSLDVKDPAAAGPTLAVAESYGATDRLWLCHYDWQTVAGWRAGSDAVKLVDSTRLKRIDEGPERRASRLEDAGIDAVNLPYQEWTGGTVTLFHRFGRLAFGWDAQFPHVLEKLLIMGIDGLYSDHVDRMVDAFIATDRRMGGR